jgi:hypothetical protein
MSTNKQVKIHPTSGKPEIVGARAAQSECLDHSPCRLRFGFWTTMALLSLALTSSICAAQAGGQIKKPSAAFRLLYGFTGAGDGYLPFGGLAFDKNGALYGTNFFGGTVNNSCPVGCGTVFQLLPTTNGPWTQNTLHSFAGYPSDVGHSYAHVTFGTKGNLFGTAGDGGKNLCFADSCGGIFELSFANGVWQESVIYNFDKHSGETPYSGMTLYKGVLYGTTWFGPQKKGNVGYGTVFALTRGTNGQWKHKIVHAFDISTDGYEPYADLFIDNRAGKCCHGNLYGSTQVGGPQGEGNTFKLLPGSDGTWSEKLLYPSGTSTLTMDSKGTLYGTIGGGGSSNCEGGCGTVFKLQVVPGKGWQLSTLYEFQGGNDGYAPDAGLVFDAAGNLYGTTFLGGNDSCQFYQYSGCGTVFQLIPAGNGTWNKTTLYYFTGGDDGEFPSDGTLILDNAGRLYGTTLGGATYGSSGYGTVYQITP